MIDLHIHTNKSDGEYMPTDIIKMAKDNNIGVVSITDHDTVEGVNEVREYAHNENIELIPGIELSSMDDDREIHILGYYIDSTNDRLLQFCKNSISKRRDRNIKYIKQFESLNVDISKEDLYNTTPSRVISKLHFADVLLKKGYTTYFREAFKKYFNKKVFRDIRPEYPNIEETIRIIKEVGGIAVLAHPKVLNLKNDMLEYKIKEWINYGLDGIECYYTGHTYGETKDFINIANKYNMVVTGGTDYHGPNVSPVVKLGSGMKNNVYISDYTLINKMKERVQVI